jgi:hypothetical protein
LSFIYLAYISQAYEVRNNRIKAPT